MSSRGRFSSRFIKSGNHQRRPYSDRDNSFRRHQTSERYRGSFIGDRGASRDRFHRLDSYSERTSFDCSRGRERGFSRNNTKSNIRNSRHRYSRGKQYNSPQQEREIHSVSYYKQRGHGRFNVDKTSICDDEEFLSDVDNLELKIKIESLDTSDENIPFERGISPLIIHRNFEREYLKSDSRENSSEGRSRSPLHLRRKVTEQFDHKNSCSRLSRRSTFERSVSRSPRSASKEKLNKGFHNRQGSIVRSVSSFSSSKSNVRSSKRKLLRDRENYEESNSLHFIKQQIIHEKKRQRFLERQARMHEKRSESSIERFLNDCKRSIERCSESSPTPISSVQTPKALQNEKQSSSEHPLSFIPNIPEIKNSITKIHLEKSDYQNNFDNMDSNTFNKKKNSTENSVSQAACVDNVVCSPVKEALHKDRLHLSPISQVGSYEKREFESDHLENRLDLSPISQTGSFEDAIVNDEHIEHELILSPVSQASSFDQIDKRLELSPISQPGSFENRVFSPVQVYSPISLSGSLGKDDLDYLAAQKPDIKRPNSADSLQKFLEEFRYSDGSRSSSPLSNKNSTIGTNNCAFPKNHINKSTLESHAVYDRYRKRCYNSASDNSSKGKFNKVEGSDSEKNRFHVMAEKKIGSCTESFEINKRKYETYNTNQYTNTNNRSKPHVGFKSSESLENFYFQGSKEKNLLPSDQKCNIFQDKTELYGRQNKAVTTYQCSQENFYQASDLGRKAQHFPIDQSAKVLFNQFPRSNQYSQSVNQSDFKQNLTRQIQNIQANTNNIKKCAIQNNPFNEFSSKSNTNELLVDRVFHTPISQDFTHTKQEQQIHQMMTNVNSGKNYGMASESINQNQPYQQLPQTRTQIVPIQNNYNAQTQIMPHNSFPLGPNQNAPNSFPGILNINTQHEQPSYQVGNYDLTSGRPVQNMQLNQPVSLWNIPGDKSNNHPSTFAQVYGRPNDFVSVNTLHQSNTADRQPNNFPEYQNQNISVLQDSPSQNNMLPLNQVQSYSLQAAHISQIQGQNMSIIQQLDKLPPNARFQLIQSSALISNQYITKGLDSKKLDPDFHQVLGSNSMCTLQPDYNGKIPTVPFTDPNTLAKHEFQQWPNRLSQCTSFQNNMPPYSAQPAHGPYGYNGSQIPQENPMSTQVATSNALFAGTRNFLGPPTPAINIGTNPIPDILKQPACVDLKKYLTGTFKQGYKSALGLNVSNDCEGRNSIVGDCPPPVSECFPDSISTMKFKDIPPSPEELGIMFDKFVIFFGVRQNSELEKDPFVVIQESFSKSDRFGRLDVEEQSKLAYSIFQPPPKHTCVLRWKGLMLARANGTSQAEARNKASISLINSLAHTCYTVQTKYSYYCGGKLPKFMMKTPENTGVYKIFGRNEIITAVTDILELMKKKGIMSSYVGNKWVDPANISVVLNIIDDFFLTEQHSHCELIFGGVGPAEFTFRDLRIISEHVDKHKFLQWRNIKGFGRGTYIGVSRRFTPQQLYSFLLAIRDSSVRYKLLPPQERGIELLMPDCQYNPNINKAIADPQKPVIPVHIQENNRDKFKRSLPFQGGGRGRYQGNWM